MKSMGKFIVVMFLSFSNSAYSSSLLDNVNDIYDINLELFCSKDKQVINLNDSGIVERGCVLHKGSRYKHGIWIIQYKRENLIIKLYNRGAYVKSLFGHDASSIDVSIIRLIATPERFTNKKVLLTGYFVNSGRLPALYVNEIDGKNSFESNGLYIKFPKYLNHKNFLNKYNNRYVFVEGKFDSNPKGSFGFSGIVMDVYRIDLINR